MSRSISINGSVVNDNSDCYIIAEIGHNHQGDVEKAKKLFRAAKECGVNAVKLQKGTTAVYILMNFIIPLMIMKAVLDLLMVSTVKRLNLARTNILN